MLFTVSITMRYTTIAKYWPLYGKQNITLPVDILILNSDKAQGGIKRIFKHTIEDIMEALSNTGYIKSNIEIYPNLDLNSLINVKENLKPNPLHNYYFFVATKE